MLSEEPRDFARTFYMPTAPMDFGEALVTWSKYTATNQEPH